VILAVEMICHHNPYECILLGILLAPIGLTGSRLCVSFWERERKS